MPPSLLDIRHVIIEDASNAHPSEANGLHQVARSLVLEQNRAGDRARIFYFPAGEQNRPPADVPVEVIEPVGPSLKGHRFLVDRSEGSPLFREISPQTVVHIHGVRQTLLVSLTYALRARGVPYCITGHSRYAHIFNAKERSRYWKTHAYVRFLERPFLEKARFVHALTTFEADEIRHMAPQATILTLQNGVFSTEMDGAPREPSWLPPAEGFPVFGFFGRLAVEHKGLDLLVDGFTRYKHAGGRGSLQIMGTGDEERESLAAACAAAGVKDHVSILAPRFGAAKNELLTKWSFFVMPSRFDHMPLAALEAGLAGLPLILTERTGIDVTHYDAGIRIADITADAVATALMRGERLSTERWREQSRAAHHMVRAASDWTEIAELLRARYMPAEQAHTARPTCMAPASPA
jgi:glycosyltransferase involved in cell wall biosynthesis